jgi:hypothetical protein
VITRIVAAVLALLSVVPLWRMLPRRATGMAGIATAEAAASYTSLVWNGVLLALIPAVIAAFVLDAAKLEEGLAKVARPLTRVTPTIFALAVAILATAVSAWLAIDVMDGKPTVIDSFAQLTHARYIAAGWWAGPDTNAAWHIQQTIATPNGWVSQYPPGYIALLAAGFAVRGVALVGPLMLGLAVFFSALIAHEMFISIAMGRAAALLAALSPFMLGLSGAYMSHVPAAAFATAAIFFVIRAREGGIVWAAAAGAAIGALFAIRPLTGIVIGAVSLVYGLTQPLPARTKLWHAVAAFAAALPFIIAVAVYNTHFFGGPATFGYTAALGPNSGLGFGTDPWGNQYGIAEALAYTSAELIALSVHLLETPLPIVAMIGVYFALPSHHRVNASSPHRLIAQLVFWACAALVLAGLFYWHHGLFMGPRMLADTGPLWVLLAVYAAAGLIARIRADWLIAGKYSVRAFAIGGICVPLLFGLLYLAPSRLSSYRVTGEMQSLLRAPRVDRTSIVFVHGGWTSRVAMRLAAHGMRLDSVETAMRQNSTCKVHNYSLAFARGGSPSGIDFTPRARHAVPAVEISPGNRIRMTPNEAMDTGCAREIAADTAGVVDVTPFLWQGDLPGISGTEAMFVRDMGPQENAAVLAMYPGRAPLFAMTARDRVTLVDYRAGMQSRWGVQ